MLLRRARATAVAAGSKQRLRTAPSSTPTFTAAAVAGPNSPCPSSLFSTHSNPQSHQQQQQPQPQMPSPSRLSSIASAFAALPSSSYSMLSSVLPSSLLATAATLSPASLLPSFLARRIQNRREAVTVDADEAEDLPQLTFLPTPFNLSVLSRTLSLHRPFLPTPWMKSKHAQTILGTLLRNRPGIVYRREIVPLEDGGAVALDWDTGVTRRGDVRFLPNDPLAPLPSAASPSSSTRPILILFPGLTGGSRSKYLCQLVQLARAEMGFQVVVFNFRGINHPMLTPRASTGCNIEDLVEVFQHLHQCYPHAPKMGVGFSMGANMMVKALGCMGERATKDMGIVACAAVSCAFDFKKLAVNLHKPVNELLYSRFLTFQLKRNYIKQRSVQEASRGIEGLDLKHALAAQTILELDDRFTKFLFHERDVMRYYDRQSSKYVVRHIRTPLLCLNALDDPFEGEVPLACIKGNEYIILAQTKRGGHVAWATGLNPLRYKSSWMMTTTLDYLNSTLQVHAEQNSTPKGKEL